ncbi:hypothetical protein [Pseudoroseomonas ludipueritiae]|uniref:Lipoprotein n=1 Tax=Pseudoroseomonas ludipueritiae TaxID=198093 RepID=A0ABR7R8F1_9PROT|nr:hypothetical protein [Pseudoroseomonas ludipueritiae]MBC9178076.1 hypothetical protein [Pseudoroseomonas ludipueritiae]MCG7362741.1 hypothetical protein [Roseomonas sp. ACRSG]
MRFLPRVAAGLTLSLLAACATPPAGPDPALLTVVARLPQSLDGFELQESIPNPRGTEPNHTWRARYVHRASGSMAQVLIGPPQVPPLPDGPDSPAVRDVTNLLALAAQAGAGGGGLTRVPDFGVGAPGRPRELRCSDLRLQAPGGNTPVTRMMSCTTGVEGGLVSVGLFTRHGAEQADVARLFLVSFALQVTRVLRGTEAPPPPAAAPDEAPDSTRIFRL